MWSRYLCTLMTAVYARIHASKYLYNNCTRASPAKTVYTLAISSKMSILSFHFSFSYCCVFQCEHSDYLGYRSTMREHANVGSHALLKPSQKVLVRNEAEPLNKSYTDYNILHSPFSCNCSLCVRIKG